MNGPSTTDASHAWVGWSNATGELPDAIAAPAGGRGSAQMVAGRPDPPVDFQVREGGPEALRYGAGSIEPPRATWQMSGWADRATKGPCGAEAIPTEMHSVDPSSVA